MLRAAVPVLVVTSIEVAKRHYCEGLGFQVLSTYQLGENQLDPAYLVIRREGATLRLSSFSGDGSPGHHVAIGVDDVDALHVELVGRGVAIQMPPTDQSWKVREMVVADPAGNQIAFQQGL